MKPQKPIAILLTLSLIPLLWTFLGVILMFVSTDKIGTLSEALSNLLLIFLSALLIALLLSRFYSGKLKRIMDGHAENRDTKAKQSQDISKETQATRLGRSANELMAKTNVSQQSSGIGLVETGHRKLEVLIADDNAINRLLLQKQLEPYDLWVTETKDGTEAHDALLKKRFDLVLLDLKMPGYTGHELIKIIRAKESLNVDTPVVAITAHAQKEQLSGIIAEGFDECLIKPVLREHLDETLSLWLPMSLETDKKRGYAEQLLAKTHNDTNLAATLLTKLCEELPQLSAQASTLFNKKDFHETRNLIHKLHGSVSFCGLTNFQAIARQIEDGLLSQNYASIETDFQQLNTLIQHLLDIKQEILNVINGENSQ
ncbi:MAG: response regulator [Methylicorpusculum sp.]|uniref:response regulator n=1 Tax=Methylicorpusculum sp. TaxID=2713644 RepID=UPI00271E3324|nr:response regulator [Methylicorpusculum sp.]MDO8843014.1 response regulator [Methylicorpusculum sp.]MDO8938984.1 response regulator [Methylicorpusculum sp.]MDO9240624.1 response regulator [Methylicorpusculum sp.]MDP2178933.1 response regulator [Methylicorpusculum sp.]MDP2201806.1 response regulator [Methylicorpusculum sp.]